MGFCLAKEQVSCDIKTIYEPRITFIEDQAGLRHYDRSLIELGSKMREVPFGVVHRADLDDCKRSCWSTIAVKVLQEDISNTKLIDSRREADSSTTPPPLINRGTN